MANIKAQMAAIRARRFFGRLANSSISANAPVQTQKQFIQAARNKVKATRPANEIRAIKRPKMSYNKPTVIKKDLPDVSPLNEPAIRPTTGRVGPQTMVSPGGQRPSPIGVGTPKPPLSPFSAEVIPPVLGRSMMKRSPFTPLQDRAKWIRRAGLGVAAYGGIQAASTGGDEGFGKMGVGLAAAGFSKRAALSSHKLMRYAKSYRAGLKAGA